MGCDIHFYVERRVNGVWTTADEWVDEHGDGPEVPYEKSFYSDRNYDLFAMLANVRNGHGFAGVKAGEGFVPIAEPRGVPEDACAEYKALQERYGIDGHSHSYATVAELMAYDWTQETFKSGVVNLRGLARWKINGRPESWFGSIHGPGIEIYDGAASLPLIDQAIRLVEKADWHKLYHLPESLFGTRDYDKLDAVTQALLLRISGVVLNCPRPHFTVRWATSYARAAGSFLSDTMPRLWRLGKPEDVRCLFFFDN